MGTERMVSLDTEIPESMMQELERVARTESRTPDAFVQEAIERLLLLKRHRSLQEFGAARAAEKGLTERDVPRLIKESRSAAASRER